MTSIDCIYLFNVRKITKRKISRLKNNLLQAYAGNFSLIAVMNVSVNRSLFTLSSWRSRFFVLWEGGFNSN